MRQRLWSHLAIMTIALALAIDSGAQPGPSKDIRQFSTHFDTPGSLDPYQFQASPEAFISTAEHPGLLTIYHSGKDEEIKGILNEPIPLSDYPTPWGCEMDVMHSFWSKTSTVQVNLAIGINVELTFSDPSTWPADRTQKPPDTHAFQVYFVHIGSAWPEEGLAEQFLVWGDGDDAALYPDFEGDWDVELRTVHYQGKGIGPSKVHYYPSCIISSPTHVRFLLRFDQQNSPQIGKSLDVSRWGEITGVWNIGPILAPTSWIQERWPNAKPTQRDAEAYFSFVDFRSFPPFPTIEHYTHDFNHPGHIGLFSTELHGHIAETWSHPGYLTVTLGGGNNLAGGAFGPGDPWDLAHYAPPWELEYSFIAPDDTIPWNIVTGFGVRNASKSNANSWHPGVANFPGEGHKAGSVQIGKSGRAWELYMDTKFGPQFPDGVPEEILSHKPLHVLVRVIDTRRLQMGVKAKPDDPWFLTPVWESPYEIKTMYDHSFSYQTGKGAPENQQFLIDYFHYRQGLSGPISAETTCEDASP